MSELKQNEPCQFCRRVTEIALFDTEDSTVGAYCKACGATSPTVDVADYAEWDDQYDLHPQRQQIIDDTWNHRAPEAEPAEGQEPVADEAELSDINSALCDFYTRWVSDGDYLRCAKCKRAHMASRANQKFVHASYCQAESIAEDFPWQVLIRLLRPLYAQPQRANIETEGLRNSMRIIREMLHLPAESENGGNDLFDALQQWPAVTDAEVLTRAASILVERADEAERVGLPDMSDEFLSTASFLKAEAKRPLTAAPAPERPEESDWKDMASLPDHSVGAQYWMLLDGRGQLCREVEREPNKRWFYGELDGSYPIDEITGWKPYEEKANGKG